MGLNRVKDICKADGCDKPVATCMCLSCNEPWLFEYCSEKCWKSIPIEKRLRDEEDWLCNDAAQYIEKLKANIEEEQRIRKNCAGAVIIAKEYIAELEAKLEEVRFAHAAEGRRKLELQKEVNIWVETARQFEELEQAGREERDELKEKLTDWENGVKKVLSEDCPSDEHHCTCVPALKTELDERLKTIERLAELLDRNGIEDD